MDKIETKNNVLAIINLGDNTKPMFVLRLFIKRKKELKTLFTFNNKAEAQKQFNLFSLLID